jgi:hypothetical protein
MHHMRSALQCKLHSADLAYMHSRDQAYIKPNWLTARYANTLQRICC